MEEFFTGVAPLGAAREIGNQPFESEMWGWGEGGNGAWGAAEDKPLV